MLKINFFSFLVRINTATKNEKTKTNAIDQGILDNYQSDLSYALKSNTVAGRVFIDIGEMLTHNAGGTVFFVPYSWISTSLSVRIPAKLTIRTMATIPESAITETKGDISQRIPETALPAKEPTN